MDQLKTAMESTTSHGLPRMITKRPLYVRIAWLLIFLVMLGLFLKDFVAFVVKLRSRQVSSRLEANSVDFQFPDVYACFENPFSGSYSASIQASSARAISAHLNATVTRMLYGQVEFNATIFQYSEYIDVLLAFLYPQSLPYQLMVDTVAHRPEQSVITSGVMVKQDSGLPVYQETGSESYFHATYLLCIKWSLNSTQKDNVLASGSSAGLIATLNVDTNSTDLEDTDLEKVQFAGTSIPLSDWSLEDYYTHDRRAGVRVFLTPPGEYPTDFTTSFLLGPGKHHKVEIGMTQQQYTVGQFPCLVDEPDVQFVNPYDQMPSNHAYSYSYCYYYEYHKEFQTRCNSSGDISPVPWPLRGKNYMFNLTGKSDCLKFLENSKLMQTISGIQKKAQTACESKRPCTTLDYSVSISSADWPTQSTLAPFISSSIKQAWTKAKAKNLSVPALDFLLTSNASSVASYVRSNLLKVHFKPHRVLCDRVTFSIDYGLSNFISDIGGIMGIYLGMSLLTLCELLDLIYDLAAVFNMRKQAKSERKKAVAMPTIVSTCDLQSDCKQCEYI